MEWSRLKVDGKPIEPRFGHSMNLSGSDILIFGGWSHESGNRTLKDQTNKICNNYFVVLNTEKMHWMKG